MCVYVCVCVCGVYYIRYTQYQQTDDSFEELTDPLKQTENENHDGSSAITNPKHDIITPHTQLIKETEKESFTLFFDSNSLMKRTVLFF